VPKWSFLLALLFVGTSILTAFFFHRWEEGREPVRRHELASSAVALGEIEEMSRDPQSQERVVSGFGNDAEKCNCTRVPASSPLVQFESAEDCGGRFNSWSKQLEKLPPIFRDERARRPADFPRICLTYMMRQPFPRADRSASFAGCAGEKPERKSEKSCVTESYVNAMYNIFGDVTECFGIPQKEFLPEIFYNSSFHVNALGAGFETGPGFLRAPAVARANIRFEDYKKQIVTTDSDACRRLRPYVPKLQPIRLDVKAKTGEGPRCALMQPPENPLLNLLYMAIRYDQDRLALAYYAQKYDIDGLFRRAGLMSFEREQLDQMILTLASREGIATSVILVKNYLQSRIEGSKPVQLSDFDFQMGFAREDLRKPASHGEVMSFPAYLARWEKAGRGGYLSAVADSAQLLNSVFKEGTCVSDSYLSLSP